MSESWRVRLNGDVECAIGLNVDCGGAAGVYRVRDAVLKAIAPHLDAAFARGLMVGRHTNTKDDICPTCLSALSADESAASAGEP